MKIFTYLFLVVFTGCAVYSQKTNEVKRIEFSSHSRGGYSKTIEITKDSLVQSSTEGRGATLQTKRKKMRAKDWEFLVKTLNKVALTEIPDLKSPTMKRAYDGARHSAISITTLEGVVVSHSFDDEEPHEKLQQLMKAISELME